MNTAPILNLASNLNLYKPDPANRSFGTSQTPTTPNQWFVQRYPDQYDQYGSPFLELTQPIDQFTSQILLVTINQDFFAAVLGGRRDLGHHIIYYECECNWYYKDVDNVYKPTTADKLANQYRALLMKCASNMPANVHKLNLVHEWRSDKYSRSVVNRAKSICLASPHFFSATSPHQRIRGPEIHERLLMKYVSEALTSEPGNILMLQDDYLAYCRLVKQKELVPVKRSDFKAMVIPMIKDQFNTGLRNDLVVDGRSGQRGWKNVRLQALPG
jgi:hypothetical protein